MGAPPVFWWLDAYCKWTGRPYYVALQSAASEFGTTPQAIQVVQVMTDLKRRDLLLGRLRVQFFVKTQIGATQTQLLPNAYAPLIISTPEATCLDLVRYAPRVGGIERAMETIEPLLRRLDRRRLLDALKMQNDLRTLQRFGFILDILKFHKLSAAIRRQLPVQLTIVALETHLGNPGQVLTRVDAQWGIEVRSNFRGCT